MRKTIPINQSGDVSKYAELAECAARGVSWANMLTDPWHGLRRLRRMALIVLALVPIQMWEIVREHQPGTTARWLSPAILLAMLAVGGKFAFDARKQVCPRCELLFFPDRDRRHFPRLGWQCEHCNARIGHALDLTDHDKGVLRKRSQLMQRERRIS